MQLTSPQFKPRAVQKLADANLQSALKKLQGNFIKGRADRVVELEDFPAIRDRLVRNLDHYLEEFVRHATARGAVVHWAEDAADVNRIVCELTGRYGVKKAVKSKSMVSEEVELNDAMEAAGVQVVETDIHAQQQRGR